MQNAHILVIGRHAAIMETVLRLIRSQEGWTAEGALDDDSARLLFAEQHFHLVLFGGGVDDTSEKELSRFFKNLRPETRIVRHYGGGSGLLYAEIRQSLELNQSIG